MQTQIDYAPALPSRKRRRMIRRVVMGFGVLLVAALIVKSAPRAWRHVQILYWQRQAMNYSPPASKIVYDEDPVEAAKLRAADHSLIAGGHGEVFEFAKPWDRLYQLISSPGRRPGATLFLHERTDSRGERRLIVVEFRYSRGWIGQDPLHDLRLIVIKPGGIVNDPTELDFPSHYHEIVSARRRGPQIIWHAGQCDPNDASHFTIQGLLGQASMRIDGWLRDDHVELNVSR